MNAYEQYIHDYQKYLARRDAAMKLPKRERFFALFDLMAEKLAERSEVSLVPRENR